MRGLQFTFLSAVSALFFVWASNTWAGDISYIAGTKPSERPAGAPAITQVNKDGDWYRHALSGVEAPYPASLRFLEDQGNWFNPFTRPGMLSPYDLRGWHK